MHLRLAVAAADGAVGGDSLLHARGGGPATHRRGVPHLSGPRPASSTFARRRRVDLFHFALSLREIDRARADSNPLYLATPSASQDAKHTVALSTMW